jgi:hypothetical protein
VIVWRRISGRYYNQLSADSGAASEPFKGETFAIGPAIDLTFSLGQLPVQVRSKYLREFDATNRPQRNAGVLRLAIPLGVPGPEPEELSVPGALWRRTRIPHSFGGLAGDAGRLGQ